MESQILTAEVMYFTIIPLILAIAIGYIIREYRNIYVEKLLQEQEATEIQHEKIKKTLQQEQNELDSYINDTYLPTLYVIYTENPNFNHNINIITIWGYSNRIDKDMVCPDSVSEKVYFTPTEDELNNMQKLDQTIQYHKNTLNTLLRSKFQCKYNELKRTQASTKLSLILEQYNKTYKN